MITILKVEHIVSGYGKVVVVRNFNIEIEKGEIVSIIGRNGIGKSTFVKTLMGTLPTKEGSIVFKGQDITNLKAHERAWSGIGYAPQGHGVFPGLTVEENLMTGRLINKKKSNLDFELVYEYFPRLRERKKQKAGTLSGGEQAALAISRALVGNPDLLILDEPTEGIQPNIVHHISDIITKINQDIGLTVLFVEQHMGLIQQMSQRCYAMDKGTIVGEIQNEDIKNYEILKRYLAV
ncbi:ABC transporter ATP-binding protein [Cytobacillus firmus]|uniref:ABC transporter ATP-binding protein n=1 Tax=Cytobacillus firmus TaxID=1399 RepID=UPI0021629A50|nr:ABC transporter ATP-binding protein [Cytobacillus firmus]MCS0654805.1 ABC transporter ATP-binding protein [Cytobacillus firmus]